MRKLHLLGVLLLVPAWGVLADTPVRLNGAAIVNELTKSGTVLPQSVLPTVPLPQVGAWAASTAYAQGQQVVYGGSLWQAKTAFTSGSTFNASNWNALVPGVVPGTLSGNMQAGDFFLIQRGSTVYYVAPAQVPAGLLSGGGTPSYGTTYSLAGSGTSGPVGTAFTVTATPGSGGWNGNALSFGLSGASATGCASSTPTAGSSTAVGCTVTPSAGGTVTVTPSITGMTGSPTSFAYTATAVSGRPSMTMTSPVYGTGSSGQGLTGGSGRVTMSLPSGSDWTLEGTVSVASPGANGVQLWGINPGTGTFTGLGGTDNAFVVAKYAGGDVGYPGGTQNGSPHTYRFQSKSNVFSYWIDGVQQGTGSTKTDNGVGTSPVIGVGAPTPGAGYVDEVMFSSVARGTDGQNYTPGALTVDSNTLGLWKFSGNGASE